MFWIPGVAGWFGRYGCSVDGCRATTTFKSADVVQRGKKLMIVCRKHRQKTDRVVSKKRT
jgi:hypothetical protein